MGIKPRNHEGLGSMSNELVTICLTPKIVAYHMKRKRKNIHQIGLHKNVAKIRLKRETHIRSSEYNTTKP